MVDLNDQLPPNSGWLLTAATAINEQGDIVGTGIMGGEVHGFLLSSDAPPPPVGNQPPSTAASADVTSGKAPLTVNFSADGSSDQDGDALSYRWSFGDESIGFGSVQTHTYNDPGTYLATVTVSDGNLADIASVEIKVRGRRRGK